MARTKIEMLEEIYDNDLDYFQNNFDVKRCVLDGAEQIRMFYVKDAYDRWKNTSKGRRKG